MATSAESQSVSRRTGRVWHFGEHSAWVIEQAGTPWLVRFPKKREQDRRIVRHILHRTPGWEPEPEGVARLVRHLAGCQGAGRPTTRELLDLGADVVAMAQLLRRYDDQLTGERYFTRMKPIGWWRGLPSAPATDLELLDGARAKRELGLERELR